MKRSFKRVLASLLTVVMLFTVAPLSKLVGLNCIWLDVNTQASAVAYSGTCGKNLTYSFDSGVLTISGTGEMSESSYPNYSPFDNDKYIESVVVEEGVTSICTRAFYGCENLISISLPSTIEQIDGQAFGNTAYYNTESNWDNGVLYIGNHLIEAKEDLSGSYSVKDGTITIAYMAFENCASLTGINLPNSVKSIGSYAFDKCTELSSMKMSENISRIDSWAFGYIGSCNKLNYIELPDRVIDISSTAFRKTGYAQSNWENGMLYIGNHLVDVSDGMEYCEVKDGTIDIAWATFEDCSNLKIISIPDSVIHIGKYLTYNCFNLKKIYFEGSESQWKECVDVPNSDLERISIVFGEKHQHSFVITKANEIASTCMFDGGYENIYYCEECECEVKREFVTVKATGHNMIKTADEVSPTCISVGKEAIYVCSYGCGEASGGAELPITDHECDGSKCKNCDYDRADDCACTCHRDGIVGFLSKIVLFFQNIFGNNLVCVCGKAHRLLIFNFSK